MQHLQESLHKILQHGKNDLGKSFYLRFFAVCPEAQAFFRDVDLSVQANILVNALHVVVSHANHHFPATESYLKILGNRHHQRGIPVHLYLTFFAALLEVLEEFHADSWEPDLAREWRDAFDLATHAMIAGHMDGPNYY